MKYRIHYSIGEYEDSLDIEGETIEEIKEIAFAEKEKRGLTIENNNLWSERLDN